MKNKLLIVTDLGLLKAYRLDATPQGTPRRLLSSLLAESPAGHETTPTRSLVGAPLQDAVRENASNVHLDPKHYPFKFRSESFGKMWWTATEDSSESSDVMLSHSTMRTLMGTVEAVASVTPPGTSLMSWWFISCSRSNMRIPAAGR